MRMALYPGSFDPVTYGHLNVIRRGRKLFDRVLVAVAKNVRKEALFTPEERMEMIRQTLVQSEGCEGVEVGAFTGLLADVARLQGATCILRGLRAVSDFEFEFQLAHMNRRLGQGLDTVFVMTGEEHFYVSSRMVREAARFGGNISGLVPPHVEAALKRKYKTDAM